MLGGRFLTLLIVSAAGLLAAALSLSTGGEVAGTAVGAVNNATDPDWLRNAVALAQSFAPTSRGEVSALLIGLVAGWSLRWLYALPWGSVPRAISDWLLSWRTSAAMVGLAVGCTAVLLFY